MTTWWNKNAENRMDDFKVWVGDFDEQSKIYCRKYIADKQYKDIIDCGCGLASEYFGFKKDSYNIDYTGLDSCKYFVNLNKERGINMIEAELETDLPLLDNSYELAYCREIIEHLSYYEKTISELVRIASKEVMIIFFINPDEEEVINYWEEEDLYHNKYSKDKLEKFITDMPKVKKLSWETVEDITNRKDVLDELDKKNNPPIEIIEPTIEATETTVATEATIEAIVQVAEIQPELVNEPIPEVERPTVKIQKYILHIILND